MLAVELEVTVAARVRGVHAQNVETRPVARGPHAHGAVSRGRGEDPGMVRLGVKLGSGSGDPLVHRSGTGQVGGSHETRWHARIIGARKVEDVALVPELHGTGRGRLSVSVCATVAGASLRGEGGP